MKIVVLISANAEWKVVKPVFPGAIIHASPYGEWFEVDLTLKEAYKRVTFFHGGWGKVSAAGSTQYVIDRWQPDLLVNLGTCGGFEGKVERGTILLVERTVIYDIYEQMGDHASHIAHYSVDLDLNWLREPYPSPVQRTLIVSGDQDLDPNAIPKLSKEYGAIAGDWESGAIAFVANRNKTPILILRGVSDLVNSIGGEAYEGSIEVFHQNAAKIMQHLVEVLPAWLDRWNS